MSTQKTTDTFEIKDFMNRITIYQYSALSEDGRKLAYITNLTGSPQVWVGEIDPSSSKMLFPKPITTETDRSPHIFASALEWIGSDKLVIMFDRHGDENTKISIFDLKTGKQNQIPEANGRDFHGFVSKDKKTLFFSSNRDDLKSQGLYSYDLKTDKVQKHHVKTNSWASWTIPTTWKGYYFFQETLSNTSSLLKAINLKTGIIKDIFVKDDCQVEPVAILPKDRLLITTNYEREFMSLAILSLITGEIEYFQKDSWDIEFAKLSRDQKNLFVARNVAGQSVLEHYAFPSLKQLSTRFKKEGVISSIDYNEKNKSLIIGYWSPIEPKNFYRLSLKNKKIDRLTDTWTSKVPESNLVLPKPIWYKSKDQNIHSWLLLPKKAKKNKTCPVIIWPHGGPQAQERATFRPVFQYFLSLGFAIWAPNPSGSTGYGISFCRLIEKNWGTADFPDMLAGIEWLKNSGWINSDKIAIMGGSYGGYMTLRSLTKIPNTFKAAVDIFGVSNLISFSQNVPEDWRFFMDKLVGNPITDKEMLIQQSPISSIEKIDCPLLVIQGAKDPRVVKSESDQVVERLESLNKKVEYLVFADEGHGFLKPENELAAFKKASDFLRTYIGM